MVDKRTYQDRKIYTQALKKKYPDRYKSYWHKSDLKRRYNTTPEEMDALLIKQNGRCALCGGPPTKNGKLDIDHDHKAGKVRGLLCHKCNYALGLLQDDSGLLLKASNYLEGVN